jgi:arylsulfatase A-like enzyme
VDTPFVDQFVEGGLEFTEQYATATTTSPCVASLFTGTYSERNGVNSLQMGSLNDGVDTMAECLSDAGFETAAMVTGPLVGETGVDRGFDHYWYREPEDRIDGEWFDTGVGKMGSLSEPFFLYLHLWEIHEPVTVPSAFDHPEYGSTEYGRAFSALDRSIGEFVGEAPESTLVALHGDHGESLPWANRLHQLPAKVLRDLLRHYGGLDTRGIESRINRFMDRYAPDFPDQYLERGHGENVHDFTANVPFALNGPGIEAETVDAQVRQVDVLPTILDYYDLPVPENVHGESLLPPEDVEDRVAYVRACGESLHGEANWHRGVRVDGYKYVEIPDREWGPELYDLEADPCELRNLADERPDKLAEVRAELPEEELLEAENIGIQDRLEDLGYL